MNAFTIMHFTPYSVGPQTSSCGIYGEQGDNDRGLFPGSSVTLCH